MRSCRLGATSSLLKGYLTSRQNCGKALFWETVGQILVFSSFHYEVPGEIPILWVSSFQQGKGGAQRCLNSCREGYHRGLVVPQGIIDAWDWEVVMPYSLPTPATGSCPIVRDELEPFKALVGIASSKHRKRMHWTSVACINNGPQKLLCTWAHKVTKGKMKVWLTNSLHLFPLPWVTLSPLHVDMLTTQGNLS